MLHRSKSCARRADICSPGAWHMATRFHKNTLAKEITIVLAIKLCLILVLWFAFFRVPIDRHSIDRKFSEVIFGQAIGTR